MGSLIYIFFDTNVDLGPYSQRILDLFLSLTLSFARKNHVDSFKDGLFGLSLQHKSIVK